MKIALEILPKTEVLDIQGRAVKNTLKAHGFKLKDCHVGKYIVLELDEEDKDRGIEMVRSMAEKGLYNPLIEDYRLILCADREHEFKTSD